MPGGVQHARERRRVDVRASAGRRSGRGRAAVPIPTANTAISTSPSHHSGIEYSVSDDPVENRSKASPFFHALRMPIQTPMTAASTVDVPTSSRVGHIRSARIPETSRW